MHPRKQFSSPPSHRHATPSGPWPFLDVSDEIDRQRLLRPPPQPQIDNDDDPDEDANQEPNSHREWTGYPQAQYANWTEFQQEKSGIARIVKRKSPAECRVFKVDVSKDGTFHTCEEVVVNLDEGSIDNFWGGIQHKPAPQVRVRAFFVDNLSGPVLQMLGTRFQIEPFFFSSSLKSIPSRYQEQVQPGKGDHITITLSFIRPVSKSSPAPSIVSASTDSDYGYLGLSSLENPIDISGPLRLQHSTSNKTLTPDLLSFHIIRRRANESNGPQRANSVSSTTPHRANSVSSAPYGPMRRTSTASTSSQLSHSGTSTIISYHPPSPPGYETTTASTMCTRLQAAGRSVYWSRIFQSTVSTGDPTFVALSLLWYAMYAWDEVMELLLSEVGWLESQTLSTLPHPDHPERDPHRTLHELTYRLHLLRAHLLHYQSLLSDFRKSVMFLRKTANPALTSSDIVSPPLGRPNPQTGHGRRPSVPRIATGDLGVQPLAPVPENSPSVPASVVSAYQETSEQLLSRSAGTSGTNPRSPWLLQEQHGDRFMDEEAIDYETEVAEMDEELEESEPQERMLKKESRILLNEIERLETTSRMLDKRLGNVMHLAFSSVNIEDSKRMSELAEAAGRDSAVMKQISYLTMVFLPASFIATVFGMNVKEINDGSNPSLSVYLATAIPLTVVTVWVMMIFYHSSKQSPSPNKTPSTFIGVGSSSIWHRGLTVMWRPLGILLRGLSPWQNRTAAERAVGMSWTSSRNGTKSRVTSARNSVRTRASTIRQLMTGRETTDVDV